MIDDIIRHRARAKALLEKTSVKDHPWKTADKDLQAAEAAEKRRLAAEIEQRDRAEAESLLAAIAAYRRLLIELRAASERLAKVEREIADLGDARDVQRRYAGFLGSPAGLEWTLENRHSFNANGSIAVSAVPPRFSREQLDRIGRLQRLDAERTQFAGEFEQRSHDLGALEQEYPVLCDIRKESTK